MTLRLITLSGTSHNTPTSTAARLGAMYVESARHTAGSASDGTSHAIDIHVLSRNSSVAMPAAPIEHATTAVDRNRTSRNPLIGVATVTSWAGSEPGP